MDRPRYLVLGPLLVDSGAGPATPGGPTCRTLLADLIVNARHPVTVDRLLYDTWGAQARPDTHAHTLHTHITRLRRLVGAERIVQEAGTYCLDAGDDEIDARCFEAKVRDARAETDPAMARRLGLEALGLWRGIPFGDLSDLEFLHLEVRRLEEIRLSAIEACLEADLELGHHSEVLGSLQAAVAEYPFHERIRRYYIESLAASGRRPEAVLAYDEFAALLREEFGIEPGADLCELRDAIAAG